MSNRPVVSTQDVLFLLRLALLENAGVSALVGPNVRTSHVVAPDATLTYPLVVVSELDGFGGYEGGLQSILVEVYAYSDESEAAARSLYDAVYSALHATRLYDPSATIAARGSARETGRPSPGWNEEVRAWYLRGVWTVVVAGGPL